MPFEVELALRILGAALLGALVGIEREARDQPAGFRTHILVAVGSCLFTLISAYGFAGFLDEEQVTFDPTRIAAQIVTGIGFLGAGAILRSGMSVRGLTTAASLWVVAAVGLAVGAGAYVLASTATGVTLLALFVLRPLRSRLVRGIKQEVEDFTIVADAELELDDLLRRVKSAVDRIDNVRVEEEDGVQHVGLVVRLRPGQRPEDVVDLLRRTGGVRNADWSR
ncbi:MAG TPA: MgtC/SapB family protein [Actinomycetota bacterium]|nr:MgtC/SapB family protein [Actinomycetota bacterium]